MSFSLSSQLESILFVASKPLSLKQCVAVLHTSEELFYEALEILKQKYNTENSGIIILENNSEWQIVSNPINREITEQFIKTELSPELTRPQLETLTVISYCGPISRAELEQIRGVNCSIILRNLLIRGLIKEIDGNSNELLPYYEVTMDYIRHLGIESVQSLPDYEKLHQHEYVAHAISNISNEEVL